MREFEIMGRVLGRYQQRDWQKSADVLALNEAKLLIANLYFACRAARCLLYARPPFVPKFAKLHAIMAASRNSSAASSRVTELSTKLTLPTALFRPAFYFSFFRSTHAAIVTIRKKIHKNLLVTIQRKVDERRQKKKRLKLSTRSLCLFWSFTT